MLGSQIRANADTLTELIPEHFAFFQMFSQMGGLHGAQRVFGGEEGLRNMLDSLNSAVFSDIEIDQQAGDEDRPTAH